MILDQLLGIWNTIVSYVGKTTIILQVILGLAIGTFLGLLHRGTSKVAQVAVEKKTEFAYAIFFIIGILIATFYNDLASALSIDPMFVLLIGVLFVLIGLSKVIFRGVRIVRLKGLKGLKEA
ncbi:MAG: hypothetical protein ACP6IU_15010 [Candidatus Asgardarchaeia archaeon]